MHSSGYTLDPIELQAIYKQATSGGFFTRNELAISSHNVFTIFLEMPTTQWRPRKIGIRESTLKAGLLCPAPMLLNFFANLGCRAPLAHQ